jgi:murein DD-endopeptidase / murein LD-carboxypeptidase
MVDILFTTTIRIFIFIALAGFLTSCSGFLHLERETPPEARSRTGNRKLDDFIESGTEKTLNVGKITASEIIETAGEFLGVPHCMGGTTRKCMDCSGLLKSVFAFHGIHLPHNSEEQARYGKIITSMEQLRRGDLVFFTRSYRTTSYITHSGIYAGNNEFIHASSSRGVTITSMDDPWWKEKFVFGTRIFDP